MAVENLVVVDCYAGVLFSLVWCPEYCAMLKNIPSSLLTLPLTTIPFCGLWLIDDLEYPYAVLCFYALSLPFWCWVDDRLMVLGAAVVMIATMRKERAELTRSAFVFAKARELSPPR